MNRLPRSRARRLAGVLALLVLPVSVDSAQPDPGRDEDSQLSRAEVYNNRGTQHAARGDYRQAAGAFRKAIEFDPGMTVAHYNLGLALSRVKNHRDAAFALQAAVRLSPRYFEARLQLGLSLMALNQYGEAAIAFEECLSLKQGDPVARFRLGQSYWKAGNWERVIANWTALLNESPAHPATETARHELPRAYYNLGLHHQDVGNIDAAREAYDEALRRDSRYVPALNNLAIMEQAANRDEKAAELFGLATEIDPEHEGARLGLAGALLALGRIPEAIEHYQGLQTRLPEDGRAYRGLALCHIKSGDRDKALEWVAAAEERSDRYEARLLEAFVYEHNLSGERYGVGFDDKAAEEVYRQVIELYPGRAEAHYNLGVIHARVERWEHAVASLERVLAIDSTYAAARVALAEVERVTKSQNIHILRIKRP